MLQSLLSRFISQLKNDHPEITKGAAQVISYGQAVSGMNDETIQSGIEWVFLSLLVAGYQGQAHLFWLDSERDEEILKMQRKLFKKNQPIFFYRCDDRVPPAPDGFYWRLMPEHPAMRIYQLEPQDEA